MSIKIYGFGGPTYVQAARLALEEKGVAYELVAPQLRSPEYRKLHPFGKMPVLQHGDVSLYEALAIVTYIEGTFDGPSLQPSAVLARAHMMRWVSSVLDYIYPMVVKHMIQPTKKEKDEALRQSALDEVDKILPLIAKDLENQPFLAGQTFSLADIFLAPIFEAGAKRVPAFQAKLNAHPAITGWLDRLQERPSVQAVMPRAS